PVAMRLHAVELDRQRPQARIRVVALERHWWRYQQGCAFLPQLVRSRDVDAKPIRADGNVGQSDDRSFARAARDYALARRHLPIAVTAGSAAWNVNVRVAAASPHQRAGQQL